MSRLKEYYKKNVKSVLKESAKIANVMMIPQLKKIVINMGIAEATKDKNLIQDCIREMTMLSGQKPIQTKARNSIAGFKLREGQVIGLKVTLRGERMWEFLDRFNNVVCPRIRDFRGLPSRCDGQGNYTLGLDDQQVFPEINLDLVKRAQGMNISFVTSTNNDEHCIELLRLLGVPFADKPVVVTAN
jgi:large subunit ribosomal protein L5